MADPMRGDKKPPAANFATTTTPSSASSTVAATNFEYDNENEWDVGIGDLIIDLDADIEKTTSTTLPPSLSTKQASTVPAGVGSPIKHNPGGASSLSNAMAVEHSASVDKHNPGLKMKIKRTQKPSGNKQHEIVKSGGANTSGPSGAVFNSNSSSKDRTGSVENGSDSTSTTGSTPGTPQNKKQAASNPPSSTTSSHRKGDKKSSAPPTPTSTPYHPPPHCDELLVGAANTPGPPFNNAPGSHPSSSSTGTLNNSSSSSSSSIPSSVTSSGHALSDLHDVRHKPIKTEQKETADVCIGTSVGTITEPECLGPCEPGTSVTLEGIVWHETEGVLVVNVTWRGKTYVGTLLDCTRHDWAPPRFCDSPTSDLDARTTKNSAGGAAGGGRSSKRGRSSAGANVGGSQTSGGGNGGLGSFGSGDSGFTETRSSKLRNNSGGSSGKDGRDGNSSNGNSSNGSGKDAKSQRRTTNNSNSTGISTGTSGTSSPVPFLPPRPDKRKASKDEGANVTAGAPNADTSSARGGSSESKKSRNSSPPPPVLLECPDPNCSKKYKHINGLRYHQNHAHGGVLLDEDSNTSNTPAAVRETETDKEEETPDIAGDGGDSTLRLPGDGSGPSPSPGSQPATNNSTGPSTPSSAGSGTTTGPAGFKIKSPASLLTDVHSLDSSSNGHQNMDLASNASPHVKKKRKLDEEGDDRKSTGTGAAVSQESSGQASAVQSGPAGPAPLAAEPSSPAYSDISDDETRGPQARYPPEASAPGPGYPGLPPGAVPSSGEKLDLHKDLLKAGAAPNSWSPADASNVAGQPPVGLSHPISYYPYSLSGGYPYGQVPSVGPPGSAPLGPVGPPGSAPPTQPPQGGPLPPLGHGDKSDPASGDKSGGGNENHQILKESHEVKTQVLLPGTYQRPGPQDVSGNRFYLYNSPGGQPPPEGSPGGRPRSKDPLSHPSPNSGKLKDVKKEREEDGKTEGVKPTMETQGPPPPPTSQPYAYIHTGYHLPPYQYGDAPPHPPGPYRGPPLLPSHHLLSMHLHPHARYPPTPGPEDLSPQHKGLDMYYQAASQQHKIHELQDRALKSPNAAPGKQHGPSSAPGTPSSAPSPSSQGPGERGPAPNPSGPGNTAPSPGNAPPSAPLGKEGNGGRRSSSPPPQRHVHTHHHTHVGLGYSILAGQYPAPYGAAAVQAVINQYPPTTK